jgi:hypothetical protein
MSRCWRASAISFCWPVNMGAPFAMVVSTVVGGSVVVVAGGTVVGRVVVAVTNGVVGGSVVTAVFVDPQPAIISRLAKAQRLTAVGCVESTSLTVAGNMEEFKERSESLQFFCLIFTKHAAGKLVEFVRYDAGC